MMQRDENEKGVAELLGGLQRVDAPAGFEDRVMRRIMGPATGERSRGPGLLLALKFAVPASALLLMGTVFVFFGGRDPDVTTIPPVQEGQVQTSNSEEISPTAEISSTASPSSLQARRPPKINASRPSNGSAARRSGVNSEDIALQGPGETYTPSGQKAPARNIEPPDRSPGGVNIRDALSLVGIAADCDSGGCRVNSLSKGSLAERAKLSVGDRIISIDGRPLNDATAYRGSPSFRTFEVDRGGRTINLTLGTN